MDNQVTKAWIVNIIVLENGEVFLDVDSNCEQYSLLVIVLRATNEKLVCNGTADGSVTHYQLPGWEDIISLFGRTNNATHILDFYVTNQDDSELVRINFDATNVFNEQLFFTQSKMNNLIYRPYSTIKGKFSIEIDYVFNEFENTTQSRTILLEQIERLGKKYFLNHNERLVEATNLIIIKKPRKAENEARLVNEIIDLATNNKYKFIGSEFLSPESKRVLSGELGKNIVFFDAADEMYYEILGSAQYEYSLKNKLRFNPIRDSGILVKNAILIEHKNNNDEFKIKIKVELYDNSSLIEYIKLELYNHDSSLSKLIEASALNMTTKIVSFNLNVDDFKEIIDTNRWIGSGLIRVRLLVGLEGKQKPIFGNFVVKTSKTKLDSEFAVPDATKKSFVVSPHFIKNSELTFGINIIETNILAKYILSENNLKIPFMNTAKNRLTNYYATNYNNTRLDKDVILYETRSGRSVTCSPYAIFKHLVDNPEYAQLKHYWIVREGLLDEIKAVIPPTLLNKMILVARGSKEHFDLLLTAKYIIVNGSCLQPPFRKKKGQIIINTWHGIPIKHMAFDTPAVNIPRFRNILRHFMTVDYFISPNEHTTNIMINAYKLHGLFKGEILEYGYPRMDVTVDSIDCKTKNLQKFLKYNKLPIDQSKPNLVYMPTWRGGTTRQAMKGVEFLVQEVINIKTKLSEEYNVFVKVHPFLFEFVKFDLRLKGTLISDFCDPNEILAITDVMIADYSSVFFDFLPTKKPIVYYMKDRHEYENDRGLYISPDALPGAIVYTIDELVASLKKLAQTDLRDDTDVRSEFINKYSTYDDGFATKRIVEWIFKGVKPVMGRTLKLNNKKQKVLIKLETLDDNELFEKYQELIKSIDFKKFDVTQLSGLSTGGAENSPLVDSKIRQMFDSGVKLFTVEELILRKHYEENGENSIDKLTDLARLLKAEKREESRLVPIDMFDYVIEFNKDSITNFEKSLTKEKSVLNRIFKSILKKE